MYFSFVLCVFLVFVLPSGVIKNDSDVMFCLQNTNYQLCRSHSKKHVNCAVWEALQQSLYRIPVSNLDDLKDRVRICWESLDQHIINKSIDQWHDRLKAVVRTTAFSLSCVACPPFTRMVDTSNSCFEYGICLICCHALLYIAILCILRTCVHFAIVYRALP